MNTTCIINKHKISKTAQEIMEFILADENQSITGFVVTNKDGAVTIINQNAVRRFQSHEDYMVMMNPNMDGREPKSKESLLDDFFELTSSPP